MRLYVICNDVVASYGISNVKLVEDPADFRKSNTSLALEVGFGLTLILLSDVPLLLEFDDLLLSQAVMVKSDNNKIVDKNVLLFIKIYLLDLNYQYYIFGEIENQY